MNRSPRYHLKFFTGLILLFVFFCPRCFADKGVFSPKATPAEVLIDNLPATIKVSAEIGDVPFIANVKAYQTTANGKTIRLLCNMRFDKRRFFTGKFTIINKKTVPFYFKIVAVYTTKERFTGPVQKVLRLADISDKNFTKANDIVKALALKCREYRRYFSPEDTGKQLARDAKKYKGLEFYWNGDGASMVYAGIRMVIGPSECQPPGAPPVD